MGKRQEGQQPEPAGRFRFCLLINKWTTVTCPDRRGSHFMNPRSTL